MKILIYVLLFTCVSTICFAQNELASIVEIDKFGKRVITQSNLKNNGQNANYRIDSLKYFTNNDTSYPVVALLKYIYDAENKKVGDVAYSYDNNNTIIGTTKNDFIYTNDSLYSYRIGYQLINGVWIERSKAEYIYSGDTTITHSFSKDTISNSWDTLSFSIHIYNSNNQLIEHYFYSQNRLSKVTRTYNANNQLVEQLSEMWDTTAMTWRFFSRGNLTYNNQGLPIEDIGYFYSSFSGWNLRSKSDYIYNAANQLTNNNNYNYDGSVWKLTNGTSYGYDVNGNQNLVRFLNYDDNQWIENRKVEIFYSGKPVSTNQIAENIQLNYYPNPTSDFINIELNERLKQSRGQLFDLNGRILKQYNFNGNLEQIDISNLPNGNYFLRINNEENQAVLKILKQ